MSDSETEDNGVYGFIPKKKCSQIRGCGDLFIYLKQNPKTFVSAITFVTSLTCVLLVGIAYSVKFHPVSCYFIAGIAGIVSNLYGFCHFRTLMNLKKEVDVYSNNNIKFQAENTLLTKEVNRFSSAKDELKDTRGRIRDAIKRQEVNLKKFRQLNVNLEATGKQNLELLGNLNSMASRMETKWKDQLFSKERKILHVCFDRFDWENNLDGITRKQFTEFKLTLPMEYQLRLTRAGDWKTIAGDDGILQLDEFVELLDNFAQDVVTQQHEVRMSQTLDNDDLKEFQTFAPDTGNTNDNDNDGY
eukprot:838914_1